MPQSLTRKAPAASEANRLSSPPRAAAALARLHARACDWAPTAEAQHCRYGADRNRLAIPARAECQRYRFQSLLLANLCSHAGHDLSQAMARSARNWPPTKERHEVSRQQMRHCKFGTQARERGDLQDPFASAPFSFSQRLLPEVRKPQVQAPNCLICPHCFQQCVWLQSQLVG